MNYFKPKIVVSKCLNFEHCRFDGSMIGSDEIVSLLPYVEFIPLCPEMEIGLPSPRASLRLVQEGDSHVLLQNKTGNNMTGAMLDYSGEKIETIREIQPEGFILKSRSPSCGIKEVKLYKSIEKGPAISRSAKGIFASEMMEAFPSSIFEDEGRLSNFAIREHFYTVIFTMAEFNNLKKKAAMKDLVAFHGKNKYLFMAYSQSQLKKMGSLVANHEKLDLDAVMVQYEEALLKLFAKKPSKGQNINVMMHIFGYFSKNLNNSEKAHLLDALEDYQNGTIPGSTVMAMLYSWVLRFGDKYLQIQSVFQPYPKALIKVTDSGKGL